MSNIPDGVYKDDVIRAIDQCVIGKNGERDRKILYRRLIDGIGYEDLSAEFGISVRHLKDIVPTREDKIFKYLGF